MWGSAHRNYLRVRGEYRLMPDGFSKVEELPPRARRIQLVPVPQRSRVGTTSACAENTQTGATHPGRARNYLRVRGEYDR